MTKDRRPIDDYALAAFITGKLPGKMREQIIDALQDDEEARQLLKMAYEALTEAKHPDDAMQMISERWRPAA
jgi:hypothetical protein